MNEGKLEINIGNIRPGKKYLCCDCVLGYVQAVVIGYPAKRGSRYFFNIRRCCDQAEMKVTIDDLRSGEKIMLRSRENQ